jgi:ketosteroid isomerase-like protein
MPELMGSTMKRLLTVALLVVCCWTILIQSAVAQEAEVRAAMEESLAAWRAGDFQALGNFYAAQTRGFMLDGGFLINGFSMEALEAAASMGVAFDIEPQEIDIMMAGEGVAVAVALLEGTVTLPGGSVQEGSWRYSETRIKEGGVWKVLQYHFSPLEMTPLGGIE